MAEKFKILLSIFLMLLFLEAPIYAARDTNSYDGNIFPIYAGNGSLVPPPSTLSESLENGRTSVIVYYLDDSATSKAFAPVVSGIKLLWGPSVDLMPLTTDELVDRPKDDPKDEAFYWRGNIPQIVVIDGNGDLKLDKEGQVTLDEINDAISSATGLSKPDFTVTIKSFNEYNSEPSKDGYTDAR